MFNPKNYINFLILMIILLLKNNSIAQSPYLTGQPPSYIMMQKDFNSSDGNSTLFVGLSGFNSIYIDKPSGMGFVLRNSMVYVYLNIKDSLKKYGNTPIYPQYIISARKVFLNNGTRFTNTDDFGNSLNDITTDSKGDLYISLTQIDGNTVTDKGGAILVFNNFISNILNAELTKSGIIYTSKLFSGIDLVRQQCGGNLYTAYTNQKCYIGAVENNSTLVFSKIDYDKNNGGLPDTLITPLTISYVIGQNYNNINIANFKVAKSDSVHGIYNSSTTSNLETRGLFLKNSPTSIYIDKNDNLYVTNSGNTTYSSYYIYSNIADQLTNNNITKINKTNNISPNYYVVQPDYMFWGLGNVFYAANSSNLPKVDNILLTNGANASTTNKFSNTFINSITADQDALYNYVNSSSNYFSFIGTVNPTGNNYALKDAGFYKTTSMTMDNIGNAYFADAGLEKIYVIKNFINKLSTNSLTFSIKDDAKSFPVADYVVGGTNFVRETNNNIVFSSNDPTMCDTLVKRSGATDSFGVCQQVIYNTNGTKYIKNYNYTTLYNENNPVSNRTFGQYLSSINSDIFGNLYVLESPLNNFYKNSRVSIFNSIASGINNGTFKSFPKMSNQIGGTCNLNSNALSSVNPSSPFEIVRPQKVAFDGDTNMYVLDAQLNRISVYKQYKNIFSSYVTFPTSTLTNKNNLSVNNNDIRNIDTTVVVIDLQTSYNIPFTISKDNTESWYNNAQFTYIDPISGLTVTKNITNSPTDIPKGAYTFKIQISYNTGVVSAIANALKAANYPNNFPISGYNDKGVGSININTKSTAIGCSDSAIYKIPISFRGPDILNDTINIGPNMLDTAKFTAILTSKYNKPWSIINSPSYINASSRFLNILNVTNDNASSSWSDTDLEKPTVPPYYISTGNNLTRKSRTTIFPINSKDISSASPSAYLINNLVIIQDTGNFKHLFSPTSPKKDTLFFPDTAINSAPRTAYLVTNFKNVLVDLKTGINLSDPTNFTTKLTINGANVVPTAVYTLDHSKYSGSDSKYFIDTFGYNLKEYYMQPLDLNFVTLPNQQRCLFVLSQPPYRITYSSPTNYTVFFNSSFIDTFWVCQKSINATLQTNDVSYTNGSKIVLNQHRIDHNLYDNISKNVGQFTSAYMNNYNIDEVISGNDTVICTGNTNCSSWINVVAGPKQNLTNSNGSYVRTDFNYNLIGKNFGTDTNFYKRYIRVKNKIKNTFQILDSIIISQAPTKIIFNLYKTSNSSDSLKSTDTFKVVNPNLFTVSRDIVLNTNLQGSENMWTVTQIPTWLSLFNKKNSVKTSYSKDANNYLTITPFNTTTNNTDSFYTTNDTLTIVPNQLNNTSSYLIDSVVFSVFSGAEKKYYSVKVILPPVKLQLQTSNLYNKSSDTLPFGSNKSTTLFVSTNLLNTTIFQNATTWIDFTNPTAVINGSNSEYSLGSILNLNYQLTSNSNISYNITPNIYRPQTFTLKYDDGKGISKTAIDTINQNILILNIKAKTAKINNSYDTVYLLNNLSKYYVDTFYVKTNINSNWVVSNASSKNIVPMTGSNANTISTINTTPTLNSSNGNLDSSSYIIAAKDICKIDFTTINNPVYCLDSINLNVIDPNNSNAVIFKKVLYIKQEPVYYRSEVFVTGLKSDTLDSDQFIQDSIGIKTNILTDTSNVLFQNYANDPSTTDFLNLLNNTGVSNTNILVKQNTGIYNFKINFQTKIANNTPNINKSYVFTDFIFKVYNPITKNIITNKTIRFDTVTVLHPIMILSLTNDRSGSPKLVTLNGNTTDTLNMFVKATSKWWLQVKNPINLNFDKNILNPNIQSITNNNPIKLNFNTAYIGTNNQRCDTVSLFLYNQYNSKTVWKDSLVVCQPRANFNIKVDGNLLPIPKDANSLPIFPTTPPQVYNVKLLTIDGCSVNNNTCGMQLEFIGSSFLNFFTVTSKNNDKILAGKTIGSKDFVSQIVYVTNTPTLKYLFSSPQNKDTRIDTLYDTLSIKLNNLPYAEIPLIFPPPKYKMYTQNNPQTALDNNNPIFVSDTLNADLQKDVDGVTILNFKKIKIPYNLTQHATITLNNGGNDWLLVQQFVDPYKNIDNATSELNYKISGDDSLKINVKSPNLTNTYRSVTLTIKPDDPRYTPQTITIYQSPAILNIRRKNLSETGLMIDGITKYTDSNQIHLLFNQNKFLIDTFVVNSNIFDYSVVYNANNTTYGGFAFQVTKIPNTTSTGVFLKDTGTLNNLMYEIKATKALFKDANFSNTIYTDTITLKCNSDNSFFKRLIIRQDTPIFKITRATDNSQIHPTNLTGSANNLFLDTMSPLDGSAYSKSYNFITNIPYCTTTPLVNKNCWSYTVYPSIIDIVQNSSNQFNFSFNTINKSNSYRAYNITPLINYTGVNSTANKKLGSFNDLKITQNYLIFNIQTLESKLKIDTLTLDSGVVVNTKDSIKINSNIGYTVSRKNLPTIITSSKTLPYNGNANDSFGLYSTYNKSSNDIIDTIILTSNPINTGIPNDTVFYIKPALKLKFNVKTLQLPPASGTSTTYNKSVIITSNINGYTIKVKQKKKFLNSNSTDIVNGSTLNGNQTINLFADVSNSTTNVLIDTLYIDYKGSITDTLIVTQNIPYQKIINKTGGTNLILGANIGNFATKEFLDTIYIISNLRDWILDTTQFGNIVESMSYIVNPSIINDTTKLVLRAKSTYKNSLSVNKNLQLKLKNTGFTDNIFTIEQLGSYISYSNTNNTLTDKPLTLNISSSINNYLNVDSLIITTNVLNQILTDGIYNSINNKFTCDYKTINKSSNNNLLGWELNSKIKCIQNPNTSPNTNMFNILDSLILKTSDNGYSNLFYINQYKDSISARNISNQTSSNIGITPKATDDIDSIIVSSNAPWKITAYPTWITLINNDGTTLDTTFTYNNIITSTLIKKDTIRFKVNQLNITNNTRQGIITVTTKNSSTTDNFTLNQNVNFLRASFLRNNLKIDTVANFPNTDTLLIESNIGWKISNISTDPLATGINITSASPLLDSNNKSVKFIFNNTIQQQSAQNVITYKFSLTSIKGGTLLDTIITIIRYPTYFKVRQIRDLNNTNDYTSSNVTQYYDTVLVSTNLSNYSKTIDNNSWLNIIYKSAITPTKQNLYTTVDTLFIRPLNNPTVNRNVNLVLDDIISPNAAFKKTLNIKQDIAYITINAPSNIFELGDTTNSQVNIPMLSNLNKWTATLEYCAQNSTATNCITTGVINNFNNWILSPGLTPNAGNGNATFLLKMNNENPENQNRYIRINLSAATDYGSTITPTLQPIVFQAPVTLTVTPDSLKFLNQANTSLNFTVKSNGSWIGDVIPNWLNYYGNTGIALKGNLDSLALKLNSINIDGLEKSVIYNIRTVGGTISRTIKFKREALFLKINNLSYNTPPIETPIPTNVYFTEKSFYKIRINSTLNWSAKIEGISSDVWGAFNNKNTILYPNENPSTTTTPKPSELLNSLDDTLEFKINYYNYTNNDKTIKLIVSKTDATTPCTVCPTGYISFIQNPLNAYLLNFTNNQTKFFITTGLSGNLDTINVPFYPTVVNSPNNLLQSGKIQLKSDSTTWVLVNTASTSLNISPTESTGSNLTDVVFTVLKQNINSNFLILGELSILHKFNLNKIFRKYIIKQDYVTLNIQNNKTASILPYNKNVYDSVIFSVNNLTPKILIKDTNGNINPSWFNANLTLIGSKQYKTTFNFNTTNCGDTNRILFIYIVDSLSNVEITKITVTQKGFNINVSPDTIIFPKSSPYSAILNLTTSDDGYTTTNANWLKLPAIKLLKGNLHFGVSTLSANESKGTKYADFVYTTVEGCKKTYPNYFQQTFKELYLLANPYQILLTKLKGAFDTIGIIANVPWKIVLDSNQNADWLEPLNVTSGTGNDAILFKANSINNTGKIRRTTFKIYSINSETMPFYVEVMQFFELGFETNTFAMNTLRLKMYNFENGYYVKIFSEAGSLIFQANLTDKDMLLDVSKIPQGNHILYIYNKNNELVEGKKFIKQ